MRRIKNFAAMMMLAVVASLSAQTAMAGIIITDNRTGIVMSDAVKEAETGDFVGEIGSILFNVGTGIILTG